MMLTDRIVKVVTWWQIFNINWSLKIKQRIGKEMK